MVFGSHLEEAVVAKEQQPEGPGSPVADDEKPERGAPRWPLYVLVASGMLAALWATFLLWVLLRAALWFVL